ncbi:MAG: ATP synthase F1 subunit epsilon [Treponema sp.]|jgi:F-type H+-transporting ATPase subunit epsilon|nr:ATP synthase F1 subunit epsilon [Treponema sp.]
MAGLFNFEVHTPFRLFYINQVQSVTLTLADGEIEVYANHSPFTAVTVTGILRIKEGEGRWRSAFISEGILEVKSEKNVLMVEYAEWPEEIDRERALASKTEAEKTLADSTFKFYVDKAKLDKRRAEYRLKISEEN